MPATSDTVDIAEQLLPVLRRGQLLTGPAQMAGYESDALGARRYRPDAVAIPADAEELIALVRTLNSMSVPWTVRGAGTSLSGGPVAAQGGVVVHLSKLNSIESIDVDQQVAVVESGVVLSQIDIAARKQGLHYPPDASSGSVCTIGGNVACNSGGVHCFRYGVTSDYVLGVEMILPDGRVERFGGAAGGRGSRRNDWKRLMIGSEGTLGVFTRFWLRLIPPPERVWTLQGVFEDIALVSQAISELSRHPAFPSAIELMDPRTVDLVENSPMAVGLPRGAFMILAEIDGPPRLVDGRVGLIEDILKQSGAVTVKTAIEEQDRLALWKARKVQGGLLGQVSPDFVVQDAVIPKAAIEDILSATYRDADAAGIAMTTVLHAGDGNLHPNFMFDSRDASQVEAVEKLSGALMKRVSEAGGTLSGEHGIGNDKAAYMKSHCGPVGYALQSTIPTLTNPTHQLNPMKVLQERLYCPELDEGDGNQTASTLSKYNSGVSRFGDSHGSSDITGAGAQTANKANPSVQHRQSTSEAIDHQANTRRLFVPFVDPIDMVACVTADQTIDEVNEKLIDHGLRFPLVCDGSQTLTQHLAQTEYAPASARFGAYVDNVLGMNWQLKSGAVARIGERVVKSATGYDLKRFLLHSDGRFGTATHHVLRLRPIGGDRLMGVFTGSDENLDAVRRSLLTSSWIHWIDSVDLHIAEGKDAELRVSADFLSGEADIFRDHFRLVGKNCDAAFEQHQHSPIGIPSVSVKTLPGSAGTFARDSVAKFGGRACVLLTSGVVFLYPNTPVGHDVLKQWSADLAESGGHVHSLDFHCDDALDNDWATQLESAWELIA